MNAEKDNHLPQTALHLEVWSKILSYLPPDDLSKASAAFFPIANSDNDGDNYTTTTTTNTTTTNATTTNNNNNNDDTDIKNNASALEEYASRLAVESTVHIALGYFREYNTNQRERERTQQGFPSDEDVDRFLEATTTTTSSFQILQLFGRYKDQNWRSLYGELYMVIDYLSKSGFGKDRNETIAHAVYSMYMV